MSNSNVDPTRLTARVNVDGKAIEKDAAAATIKATETVDDDMEYTALLKMRRVASDWWGTPKREAIAAYLAYQARWDAYTGCKGQRTLLTPVWSRLAQLYRMFDQTADAAAVYAACLHPDRIKYMRADDVKEAYKETIRNLIGSRDYDRALALANRVIYGETTKAWLLLRAEIFEAMSLFESALEDRKIAFDMGTFDDERETEEERRAINKAQRMVDQAKANKSVGVPTTVAAANTAAMAACAGPTATATTAAVVNRADVSGGANAAATASSVVVNGVAMKVNDVRCFQIACELDKIGVGCSQRWDPATNALVVEIVDCESTRTKLDHHNIQVKAPLKWAPFNPAFDF